MYWTRTEQTSRNASSEEEDHKGLPSIDDLLTIAASSPILLRQRPDRNVFPFSLFGCAGDYSPYFTR